MTRFTIDTLNISHKDGVYNCVDALTARNTLILHFYDTRSDLYDGYSIRIKGTVEQFSDAFYSFDYIHDIECSGEAVIYANEFSVPLEKKHVFLPRYADFTHFRIKADPQSLISMNVGIFARSFENSLSGKRIVSDPFCYFDRAVNGLTDT